MIPVEVRGAYNYFLSNVVNIYALKEAPRLARQSNELTWALKSGFYEV